MKRYFKTVPVILLAGCFLILSSSSCSKNEAQSQKESQEIIDIENFLPSLSYLANVPTKGGEMSEEEAGYLIEPLFEPAKKFLLANGVDYLQMFENDDPNLIVTALALMEYGLNAQGQNIQTKSEVGEKVIGAVSCVFLGEEVGEYAGMGAALLAKRLAKKILMRALPYVGTAVWVASSGACLYGIFG